MTFKELGDIHPQILEKCKERAIEQGGLIILEVDTVNSIFAGGFNWSNTIEDLNLNREGSFWFDVLNRKQFEIFYEKYPKIETIIELISDNPIIYKGIINNKKVTIEIKYDE